MPGVNIVTGNDGSNNLQGSAGKDLIYGYDPNGPQSQVSSITATRVASGLSLAVYATAAPGDSQRLFVVEQTGKIKIVDLASGTVNATPFLTVAVDSSGERGLLGLAFDPNYATNGFFYIYRTVPGATAHNEVNRYHVSADPNVADAASQTTIISLGNLSATNHNGGWIGFGPDGDLYIATGENAVAANSQTLDNLLGKILRIHPDGQIPTDNPFYNTATGNNRAIYDLGLRNPFRDSFDRATGDFYIADVGQSTIEEINAGIKGANYGWPSAEGTSNNPAFTNPIFSYDHTVGQAIIGGYVYRGSSEGLQGQYFFADEVTGKVFTMRFNGSTWVATERTSQITPDIGAINVPTSFGEDAQGNLYIVDYDGDVFRLTPNVVSADQNDTLLGFAGDDMMFGGSGNDLLDGGTDKDTMLGGRGDDSYVVNNVGDVVTESPGEGRDTIYTTVNYTLPGNVEVMIAQGAADLQINGNSLANTMFGNSGSNVIDGGAGADLMLGGLGDDSYVVDNVLDEVRENPGEGRDTIYTTANYTLSSNVEVLIAQGAADLQINGNGLANTVFGNSGSNVIDGGAGADVMTGGLGDDSYVVDNVLDQVIENPGEGRDAIYTTANYTLSGNVEVLIGRGSADLQINGNGLANTVFGNSGNNVIDGGGGADVMLGGLGDDSYVVDNVLDEVRENPGEGRDAIYTTINYATPGNVEVLIAQGAADLQINGNGLANTVFGNSGSNIIDGGAGADIMLGGLGDDSYVVDNVLDQVIESPGEGRDAVYTTVNYTLSGNVEVLIGQGGADLQINGNGLANTVFGNGGSNVIDGGAGADIMLGGLGDDSYVVDNVLDQVIENPGEGRDAIYTTVNYTLSGNVEVLIAQGAADLQVNGNGLANTVFGNSGNNVIDGGAGADILIGAAGNDTFVFRSNEANNDTVLDFTGNGAAAGDSFTFMGFGTAAQGATFTQVGATDQWQIHSGLDGHNEIITLNNNPLVHASDFLFV